MALPTGPAVTFLFTDIEGSTRLERAVGADIWALVVAEHDRRLRDAIEAQGGHVVKTEGDAVFAAFDSAHGAVSAVIAGQRALAAEPLIPAESVRVRAGLHLGLGRVRTDLAPGAPPDYVGIDVNYAARIAAAANGGQIVLSQPVASAVADDDATRPGVRLVDEGLRIVKDFEEPTRLFRLVVDGAADDDRPLRTLDAPSNLPHATTTLIGREAEIERLAAAVLEHRIVTLAGPGGSGKTRLALGVAARVRTSFPHGTWFVDLADVAEPAQFEPAIAATLNVRTPPGANLSETLAAWLRDRQVLLVLDNLEQLLPAAADAVARLVRAAPGLRVLVTSRELLRIGGEQGNQVQPLDVAAGAALFEDRARLNRPDLVIDDEARATIAEIAGRLDGLPLAIELAAARIRVLSPTAILERLGRSLDLGGGARDLPARQRTLRGAIDWSHDLLSEPERRLFRRLAVFSGGWDAESALAVTDVEADLGGDALDLLESLLDKSLVRADGEGRFSMHVLIREYAQERLTEAGELAATEERHARAIQGIAEAQGARILTADGAAAMHRLDREQYNVRAAVDWSLRTRETEVGLVIMGSIWRWFQQRGRLDEGRRLLAELLGRPAGPELVRARIGALSADGGLAYWTGKFDEATTRYEERLGLAESLDDPRLVADAHYDFGFVFGVAEDAEGIRSHEQQAFDLYASIGDQAGIERARQALSLAVFLAGDYERARELTEQNLAYYRDLMSYMLVADSLTLLSAICWAQGDARGAWTQLLEGLQLFAERDLASGLARALGMAAIIQLRFGDEALGARIAGSAVELQRVKGVMMAPARVLHLPEPAAFANQILGPERAEQLLAEGAATPAVLIAEQALRAGLPTGIDRAPILPAGVLEPKDSK